MATAQKPAPLFEHMGPLVDDWEDYLNSIATIFNQHSKHEDPNKDNIEVNLFQVKQFFHLLLLSSMLQNNVCFASEENYTLLQ